jgi:hypothetical protein
MLRASDERGPLQLAYQAPDALILRVFAGGRRCASAARTRVRPLLRRRYGARTGESEGRERRARAKGEKANAPRSRPCAGGQRLKDRGSSRARSTPGGGGPGARVSLVQLASLAVGQVAACRPVVLVVGARVAHRGARTVEWLATDGVGGAALVLNIAVPVGTDQRTGTAERLPYAQQAGVPGFFAQIRSASDDSVVVASGGHSSLVLVGGGVSSHPATPITPKARALRRAPRSRARRGPWSRCCTRAVSSCPKAWHRRGGLPRRRCGLRRISGRKKMAESHPHER